MQKREVGTSPAEVEKIVRLSKGVEGWLTDNEVSFLYVAAKKMSGRGPVVEIGSWKGRSTICLALGSRRVHGKKIIAIDPHVGSREEKNSYTLPEFRKNIRRFGVSRFVKEMVMKSEEAAGKWSGPVSFLWIDGSHEYDDVRKDFLLWEKFLMDGGMIALHDSFYSGPSKVIADYVMRSGRFSCVGHIDYITFARKKKSGKIFSGIRAFLFMHALRNIMRAEGFQPEFFRRLMKRLFLSGFNKLESF